MSYHYEVVISCFLADATPGPVLETLRWLCGLDSSAAPDGFPYRTLEPDPESPLPGGEVARLRRQVRGFDEAGDIVEWGFHARTRVLDDEMGEIYRILELIAPHVSEDGYGGQEREEHDHAEIAVFLFDGGQVRRG